MRISDWSSDVCSSDLETAIFLAEAEIVAHAQLFIGVKAADEPVELAVEGFALQAQFLREGVELAIGVGVGRAIEDVDRAIVEVARLARPIFAVGGDRGQRRAAEIIIDLAREAVIFRLAGEAAARSDRTAIGRTSCWERVCQSV